jgi:thioredoxin
MKHFNKFFPIAVMVGLAVLTGCERPSDMNKSSASVKHITQGEFEAEVTRTTNAVVADFYASWCGPCRVLSPMLDKLAGGYAGKIKFVKINVDESPGIAQNFQVQSIPTLIFFRDGKVTDRVTGLPSEPDLKSKLDAFAGGK